MSNPLSNPAVESAVIGQLLLDATGRCMDLALERGVDHEFFSEVPNQVVWHICERLYRAEGNIDELMVLDFIRRHRMSDVPWLGRNDHRPLTAIVPEQLAFGYTAKIEHFSSIGNHLTILKNLWALRQISKVGQSVALKAERGGMEFTSNPDALMGEVERVIDEVANKLAPKTTKHIAESFADVDKLTEQGVKLLGRSTGLHGLDSISEGMKPCEMWIIAGRPSLGKTSLACQVAMNSALGFEPKASIVFSLEMSSDQLAARLLSSHADVNLKRFRDGMAGLPERERYEKAKSVLGKAPMFIEDATDVTVAQMKAICRKYERDHKLGVIVIDYLQLVNPADRRLQREQQIAQMTRDIKKMAKDLRVPVILLAQLNRKAETEGRDPRPSDLRDGGSIEQDADVVLFLVNRNKDCGTHTATQEVDLIVAKNRNGRASGRVALKFNGPTYRFEDDLSVVPAPNNGPQKKFPNVQKKIDAEPRHPF